MDKEKLDLSSPVFIYALGGLGEVGKNMYCIEDSSSIIIIDCGVLFPNASMPGIDYIIPDFSHLKENAEKIKALIITHGHEDHIGGIPYLLNEFKIPIVYAPRIAVALIKNKLKLNKVNYEPNISEYQEQTKIKLGDFSLKFFHVTHSIPDSFGIHIETPQGTIIESGDFKIDLTPVDKDFDFQKVVGFGDAGVDLLLADSTNAEKEGYTPSERDVINGIEDVFSEASGRIIISTFSSNISRLAQIINTSVKNKRKIVIFGRSMENNIQASRDYGYIKVSDDYILDGSSFQNVPPNEVTILCTGNQGEPLAVLSKISRGEHKDITIIPGDTVVFSSSVIPGNSSAVNPMINAFTRLGASVVTNSSKNRIHASGHASRQEMRLLQKLIRPKYFMPIHGEYRMLKLHAAIAVDCGMPSENTFVCQNGDVLKLFNHKVTRGTSFPVDSVYIDGKNTIGLTNTIMKDRITLINEGVVGVIAIINLTTGEVISSPIVESRGFISNNKKALEEKTGQFVNKVLCEKIKEKKLSVQEIKSILRGATSQFLQRECGREPVVVPLIINQK